MKECKNEPYPLIRQNKPKCIPVHFFLHLRRALRWPGAPPLPVPDLRVRAWGHSTYGAARRPGVSEGPGRGKMTSC